MIYSSCKIQPHFFLFGHFSVENIGYAVKNYLALFFLGLEMSDYTPFIQSKTPLLKSISSDTLVYFERIILYETVDKSPSFFQDN